VTLKSVANNNNQITVVLISFLRGLTASRVSGRDPAKTLRGELWTAEVRQQKLLDVAYYACIA
jgi:hypothetical protein